MMVGLPGILHCYMSAGAAVNDRKHSDLSMWEYRAFVGNRYGDAQWLTKRHPNSYYVSALWLYA